jgi:hypothetical protein
MRRRPRLSFYSLGCAALLFSIPANAQVADAPDAEVAGIPANYTEAKVGEYKLPNPLTLANGQPVKDAKTWFETRRPEIVKLFEQNQYGRAPAEHENVSFEVFEKSSPAFDGKAIRRQVTIHFSKDKSGPKADLLIYLPPGTKKPVPLLLNVSFSANSNTVEDPGVTEGQIWNREKQRVPASSGRRFGRLNVLPTLERGFGIATIYYGDIDPDFDGGLPHGIRSLYLKPGQTEPAPDEWGSIAAWGWGLSRVVDYFESYADVDAKRVALMGVSRLGKTVMWAGARDTRFAMVIASCSGEGGAALSRRNYGERIKHLTVRYGYQFAKNYGNWSDKVDEFPVDANLLVALVAPRPLLLQTGNTDRWSDPQGEFDAAVAGGRVYEFLGKKTLGTDKLPPAGQPVLNDIGFLMHDGGHGTVPTDWDVFLNFMEMHLRPGT